MKRILCIVLSAALIFSLFCIPAFAATVDSDPGPNYVNLLDSFSAYNYYSDFWDFEVNSRSFSYATPSNEPIGTFSVSPLSGDINPNDDNNGEINPNEYLGELIYVNNLDFIFYCTLPIEGVDLVYYDRYENLIRCSGDFIESAPSYDSGGGVYTFYFDVADSLYTVFTLDFHLASDGSEVTYESLAMYRDSYHKRTQPGLSVLALGTVYNDDGAYYQQQYYLNENYILGTNINVGEDDRDAYDYLPYDNRLSVFVDFKDGYAGADKFTMNFVTTGVFDNYYDYGSLTEAGLYFKNFTGDEYNIPISAYFSKSPDLTWYGLPCYYVTVTADLSYYDLTDGELRFSCILNAREVNAMGYIDYFMKIQSAYFYFGANEFNQKLDQVFNRFTNWWYINFHQNWERFKSDLTLHFGTIWTKLDSVYNILNSVSQRIRSFDTHVTEHFTNLFDKLESYFGVPEEPVLPDQSEQQQEIQDSIDDMDGVGDDFANAGDEMEELLPSTPNYSDTGLPGLTEIASARIVELRAVFVVLWDNDFVIQVLTFSCLLALGGFILFGER